MAKIETVNAFYSRGDYKTVIVDNNTVLMYQNTSNKTNICYHNVGPAMLAHQR